ncbi:MAG: hypothetical protein AAFP00_17565, partial [Bacteroidota bacterium]
MRHLLTFLLLSACIISFSQDIPQLHPGVSVLADLSPEGERKFEERIKKGLAIAERMKAQQLDYDDLTPEEQALFDEA